MLVINHCFYSKILLTLNILRLLWWCWGVVWQLCLWSGWLVGRKYLGSLLSNLPWLNFIQFLASIFLASKFFCVKISRIKILIPPIQSEYFFLWRNFCLLGFIQCFLKTWLLESNIRAFSNWFKYIATRWFSRTDLINWTMVLQWWW